MYVGQWDDRVGEILTAGSSIQRAGYCKRLRNSSSLILPIKMYNVLHTSWLELGCGNYGILAGWNLGAVNFRPETKFWLSLPLIISKSVQYHNYIPLYIPLLVGGGVGGVACGFSKIWTRGKSDIYICAKLCESLKIIYYSSILYMEIPGIPNSRKFTEESWIVIVRITLSSAIISSCSWQQNLR